MGTTTSDCGPEDTNQLYDDHVVGEDVGVAAGRVGALLTPSLETQVEDVDVEREEEEDADEGEGGDVESASCGSEARHVERQAGGKEGRRRKGRGVARHNYG